MTCYLATYRPLVCTVGGRQASRRYHIKPFVDGSIRREPDLEHPSPTISALCRGAMFAPRLHVGDRIAYTTVKGHWGDVEEAHWRLTAVLQVERRFEDHASAAAWFKERDVALPNNCLVPGNQAKPLRESFEPTSGKGCAVDARERKAWDRFYHDRVAEHGAFLVCAPLFLELSYQAPILTTDDFVGVFGRVPGTRTPGRLPEAQFERLLHAAGALPRSWRSS